MPPTPPSSRLCFRSAPVAEGAAVAADDGGEEESGEEARRSAHCTRFSSGDRGGSALFGRGRTSEEDDELGCSFAGGNACVVWLLPGTCPGSGGAAVLGGGGGDPEDEAGQEVCGGDGVWARGERGMLPADLQRAERYWRWSFGERPCREEGACGALLGRRGLAATRPRGLMG